MDNNKIRGRRNWILCAGTRESGEKETKRNDAKRCEAKRDEPRRSEPLPRLGPRGLKGRSRLEPEISGFVGKKNFFSPAGWDGPGRDGDAGTDADGAGLV